MKLAMGSNSGLKTIRLLHRYMGLFFSPAIVFFAFSGALQTFGWHETSRGSSYVPPSWVVRMAQIHKKQTLVIPAPKSRKPDVPATETHVVKDKKSAGDGTAKFALKCFVFAMSIGLILSTVLGVVMALRYGGDVRIVWAVVIAGLLMPAAVMVL